MNRACNKNAWLDSHIYLARWTVTRDRAANRCPAHLPHEQARAAAELAAAREIQRHLVPAVLPSLPNYAIEAAYLPAREAGGDFYQVLPQTDGSLVVVIGDVSGKGLGAAMTAPSRSGRSTRLQLRSRIRHNFLAD